MPVWHSIKKVLTSCKLYNEKASTIQTTHNFFDKETRQYFQF